MRTSSTLLIALVAAMALCTALPAVHAIAENFDVNEATRILHYAYSTYCLPSSLSPNWSCSWCKGGTEGFVASIIQHDSVTDMYAVVGVNHDHSEIVVAFRGTNPLSLANWITDLYYFPTADPFDGIDGAFVHSGFLAAYKNVKPNVLATLQSLIAQYPTYTVNIAGHSLGGATAILATMDFIHNHNITNVKAYTYGAPRVGNPTFANAFTSTVPFHWRITHADDPVPHLPLKAIMGFQHPAHEAWQELLGNWKICNGSGEDPSCSDSNLFDIDLPAHLTYMGQIFAGCIV